MPDFSLDDIRKEADERYGPFTLHLSDDEDPVVLVPYLRMSTENRRLWDERKNAAENAEDTVQDVAEYFAAMLRIAARTPEDADRLLNAVGEDPAVMQRLILRYNNGTQLGEAEPSRT